MDIVLSGVVAEDEVTAIYCLEQIYILEIFAIEKVH